MQGETRITTLRKLPSNASFCYALAIVGFIYAALQYGKHHQQIALISVLVALILLGIGFFYPQLIKPLNIVWFWISGILAKIISPLIMSVLYFLFITPIGLLIKLFRKNKASNSDWKQVERIINLDSIKQQF